MGRVASALTPDKEAHVTGNRLEVAVRAIRLAPFEVN